MNVHSHIVPVTARAGHTPAAGTPTGLASSHRSVFTVTPFDANDARMASESVVTRHSRAGDGLMETVSEVKLWDKMRALELAATQLGLMKKKVEHSRARLIC